MGFKRPHPPLQRSSSSSAKIASSSRAPATKHARATELKVLSDISIHIVPAKLDASTIEELYSLVDSSGARLSRAPEDAEVLVTGISMRKRLERHVRWEVAKEKAVVTPDWLRDSAKKRKAMPCGDYAAFRDLHDSSVINCPDGDSCIGCSTCRTPDEKISETPAEASGIATTSVSIPSAPTLDYRAHYACQRASPLVCPNQDLVQEFAIIRKSRELEGENRSALSYQRAIGVIKAYPHRITSGSQVGQLPFIGTKILGLVEEYLDTGRISEAKKISESDRFNASSIFATVYGIGPVTARKLYDLGLRSLRDLELYYGVGPDSAPDPYDHPVPDAQKDVKQENDDARYSHVLQIVEENDSGIRESLRLHRDLSIQIPRDEVEEMGRVVFRELEEIQPGCIFTIVGGYRRGKPKSNDVDIVFTHPEMDKERGLCKRLVERLRERGMVTHVMHLSNFRSPTSLRKAHWDTLEKSLTVFRLPRSSPFYQDNGGGAGIHRRLDLIFAPANVYWCAVIGWTGSTMFQRDIRKYTKAKRGWQFDSAGMMRLADSSPVYAKSELEVFELCGLEWVDPTMRNADA